MGQRRVHHEPVAVLHEGMAHEAQPALLAGALAIEPGIRIGGRGMGLVRARLLAEVAFAVAARSRRLARAVFRPEALHARPGLDQRAIDGNVVARQEPLDGLQGHQARQEGAGDIRLQQPVAVVREHRRMPDGGVHLQPDVLRQAQDEATGTADYSRSAPSASARTARRRRPAAASPAATSPAGSTAAPSSNTAPRNARSVRPEPRPPAPGSAARDDRPERVPPGGRS